MPRDTNGNYSLPTGYRAIEGNKVLPSNHNPPLEDIASALTASLPRNGSAPMTGDLPMGGNKMTGLAPGTVSNDAATLAQATANAVPIGAILDFAGRTLPDGYLWPDGRAVLRADYPELDDAIFCGNENNDTAAFGYHATSDVDPDDNRSISGDYLVLPDLRAVVSAGRSNMGGTDRDLLDNFDSDELGAQFGSQKHELSVSQMPEHNHGGTTGAAGAHSHGPDTAPLFIVDVPDPTGTISGGAPGNSLDSRAQTAAVPNHQHTIPAQGGGEAHNNVQPTLVLNKILKAASV